MPKRTLHRRRISRVSNLLQTSAAAAIPLLRTRTRMRAARGGYHSPRNTIPNNSTRRAKQANDRVAQYCAHDQM